VKNDIYLAILVYTLYSLYSIAYYWSRSVCGGQWNMPVYTWDPANQRRVTWEPPPPSVVQKAVWLDC